MSINWPEINRGFSTSPQPPLPPWQPRAARGAQLQLGQADYPVCQAPPVWAVPRALRVAEQAKASQIQAARLQEATGSIAAM